jgi:hypothetical protein
LHEEREEQNNRSDRKDYPQCYRELRVRNGLLEELAEEVNKLGLCNSDTIENEPQT